MTLCIAWRDWGSRVHFFSDSRVNLGTTASDFGIKVCRMPFNIYGPAGEQEACLIRSGDIGIIFAGLTIIPLMMKEMLAEMLFRVQVVPGWGKYDMDALAKFIFQTFSIIARDVDEKTNNNLDVGIIFGGYCHEARKQKIYHMWVTKESPPAFQEILSNPSDVFTMGSGKDEADHLLSKQPISGQFIFRTLKAVIEDPDQPTVGGNIQYGDFDGIRFRPSGVMQSDIDGRAHYWRALVDFNAEYFDDSSGLVPNFPYVDLSKL